MALTINSYVRFPLLDEWSHPSRNSQFDVSTSVISHWHRLISFDGLVFFAFLTYPIPSHVFVTFHDFILPT